MISCVLFDIHFDKVIFPEKSESWSHFWCNSKDLNDNQSYPNNHDKLTNIYRKHYWYGVFFITRKHQFVKMHCFWRECLLVREMICVVIKRKEIGLQENKYDLIDPGNRKNDLLRLLLPPDWLVRRDFHHKRKPQHAI